MKLYYKMSKLIKYTDDLLAWKRPAGPIKVWRVVEGRKKNADGKTLRFSIQEIPEGRFDDVLDLMCTEFIRDEPICEYLNEFLFQILIVITRKYLTQILFFLRIIILIEKYCKSFHNILHCQTP